MAVAIGLLLLVAAASDAAGQRVSARIGSSWLSDTYLSAWGGYTPVALGPLEATLTAGTMGSATGTRYGAGFDVGLALTRWRVVAGVAAGVGRGSESDTWGSWSAGAEYRLLELGPLGLGVEARYRVLSGGGDRRSGLEALGVVSWRLPRGRAGRGGPAAGGTTPGRVSGGAAADAASAIRSTVVASARAAMGTPYVWGGTDQNGFDCSGLILHSYLQAGIALPRRSTDQAAAGVEVERSVDRLAPGDILTFAERSGPVTHVGLYLGDGEFIHSTSRGVRVSRLDGADGDTRWWVSRWIGARRVIGVP